MKDRSGLETFGRQVRRRRQELGISQEQLGLEIGLDRTYISGIERGARNPTLLVIYRLARGLNTQPATLLESAAKPKVREKVKGHESR